MAEPIRLTYVGHATILIEIDGVRILTDPLLRDRIGPLRRHGPLPSRDELGAIDTVLISHAHPDHFDRASLRRVGGDPTVVVPRGLGVATGRAGRRAHEVTVNESVLVGDVRVTAVPARHGRWPVHAAARPLGYQIEGTRGIYFAGDTALFAGMERLSGRVDVALLPVGRWGPPVGPDRLTPRTAVEAATLVGATVAMPIHWGTLYIPGFRGGRWGWSSRDAGPAFADEARRMPNLRVVVLEPGEQGEVLG
jgi:L-ascorbate metabolism protein UlaG (beta-lactamase superfamily)